MSQILARNVKAVSLSLTLLVGSFTASSAVTLGPVTDDIGVVKISKGAPIRIGGYWPLTGPDSGQGIDSKRGVEIAFRDAGNQILGHPLVLITEDSLCSAEGGQTAATKLAANPNIVIVLGPACSSEAVPGAPILWKAGITNVGTAPTAPSLTAPTRKPEYDGFVRTVYSDIFLGRSDARYFTEALKAKKIVQVHDGSPVSEQIVVEMGNDFKAAGGTVLSVEAIQPTDVDMHPLLTRIATEKPDAIYFPVFVAAAAQILTQAKTIPGLEHTPLIGGAALMTPDLMEAARDAVVGFRFGYPDLSPQAMGKGYPDFVAKYKAAYGEAPISGYHANAYDAAVLALNAIKQVAKTDSDGNIYIGRKALRDAVFTAKFDGISGRISCDRYGQCAELHPAEYEYTSGDPKTFKIGENPKKIWP